MIVALATALERLRQPALRRDTTWSVAQFVVYTALGAMQSVAVSRHFGPEVKGYTSILVLAPTVAGWLLALGITPASMYLASVRRDRLSQILTTAVGASLLLGFIAALMAWWLLDPTLGDEPGVRLAFLVSVVLIPALLVRESHSGVLLGLGEVVLFNQASIVARVVSVALFVIAVYVVSPPAFYLFAPVTLALAHFIVIGAVLRALRWRWSWSLDTLKDQLRYGLRSHLGAVSEVGLFRLDQFAVFLLLGAVPLGLYSVAVLTSEALLMLAQVATSVVFSRIAAASESRALELSRLALLGTGVGLLLAAIPLAIVSGPFVQLLFGPGFAAAAEPLRILAFAAVAQGVGRVGVAVLRAVGRPMAGSVVQLFGLAASVPLVLVFVPAFGIVGAAVGSLVAYVLVAAAALVAIEKQPRIVSAS